MNVGLIAHESKKKLMQNFCIAYRESSANTHFMQPEQPED